MIWYWRLSIADEKAHEKQKDIYSVSPKTFS
jgi:hypothetical protein